MKYKRKYSFLFLMIIFYNIICFTYSVKINVFTSLSNKTNQTEEDKLITNRSKLYELLKSIMNYDNITTNSVSYFLNLDSKEEETGRKIKESEENNNLTNLTLFSSSLIENNTIINEIRKLNDPKSILDKLIEFILSIPIISNTLLKEYDNIMESLKELNDNTNKNTFFSFLQTNIPKEQFANIKLPEPYTSSDTPCNKKNCSKKKMIWMNCALRSVALRTSYEAVNVVVQLLSKVAWGMCGCVQTNAMVKCTLIKGMPGLPCNLMVASLKGITSITYSIWKAYTLNNGFCRNPISAI